MTQIIAVHSFRGGTGKSNLTANLSTALGLRGKRVAILDTDLASPGIHVLFDFSLQENDRCLNDYLQEDVPIRDCVHEVTPDPVKSAKGRIFLLPASLDSDRIARLLREGYQVHGSHILKHAYLANFHFDPPPRNVVQKKTHPVVTQ